MSRCFLALVVSVFARLAFAEEVDREEGAPQQAVLVRVGFAQSTAGAGLSYERLVSPHLAIAVGADGSGLWQETLSRVGGSGELGARWYVFERALSGPWLGLSLTGGVTESKGVAVGGLTGLNTPQPTAQSTLSTTQLSFGGRILVGWTFRFDNRFTVQVAAGPSGGLTRSTSTLSGMTIIPFTPSTTVSLGLVAFGALGVAF